MSEINYQSLREVAERAIPAMERLLMLPADDDLLSEQELKDYGVDIDALNAFKFLTGPETVLALLDERERNLQYIKSRDQENEEIALTVGKLRVELEAEQKTSAARLEALDRTHKMFQREQCRAEAAEKRIAELEAREVELPDGYEPRMGHPINSGERVVMMPHHFGGWLDRFDVEHALQAAGIKFKTAGVEYE